MVCTGARGEMPVRPCAWDGWWRAGWCGVSCSVRADQSRSCRSCQVRRVCSVHLSVSRASLRFLRYPPPSPFTHSYTSCTRRVPTRLPGAAGPLRARVDLRGHPASSQCFFRSPRTAANAASRHSYAPRTTRSMAAAPISIAWRFAPWRCPFSMYAPPAARRVRLAVSSYVAGRFCARRERSRLIEV